MSRKYGTREWVQARSAALARDEVCQDCGTSANLHVHHIKPVREFDDTTDAHYLENLVVLCETCHPKWEGQEYAPNLIAPEFGLKKSMLVHDISLGSIDSLMPPATDYGIYQYYRYSHSSARDKCEYCHHTLKKTRGEMMRENELCAECGRKPIFWANFKSAPSESEMKKRLGYITDALQEEGITVNTDAMVVTFEKFWRDDEYYCEVETVTNMCVRMGIRMADEPTGADFFSPVCPDPKPKVPF